MSLSFSVPTVQTPGPIDDFWYRPVGGVSATGQRITPDMAMKVSTVYACVRVLASTLAMLPLNVVRSRANGDKEVDRAHPLYRVLHTRPNTWQTSFQWRQMMMGHLVLRGNAYSRIVLGGRNVAQVVPLHPDRTRVVDQRADGDLVYEHQTASGQTEVLFSDEVFALTGLSSDGVTGISLLSMMRDSVGLALATQEFGGRLFKNAPMFKGLLKQVVGRYMDEEAERRVTSSFARAHSGENSHGVALMPPGLEWESIGITPEDSQFLETRAFQVEDLLRFIGVPGVLVGHADKTATYASAEQFFQAFFTYHMAPWFVLWEQAIQRDLVIESEQDQITAEFNREGLLRGDSAARAEFYRTMIELGVFTRNEVRQLENRNRIEGLDDPLTPMNLQQGSGAADEATEPPESTEGAVQARLDQMVVDASRRMTMREVDRLARAARKHSADPAAWAAAVETFYAGYPAELDAVFVTDHAFEDFAASRQAELLADGVAVLERWKTDGGAALAAIARGA